MNVPMKVSGQMVILTIPKNVSQMSCQSDNILDQLAISICLEIKVTT